MNKSMKLLATASALAAAMAATPAIAGGTAAGTDVKNVVSVSFSVNGTAQTDVKADNTFKVDRKVAFSISETGSTTTSVTPGQTMMATAFTVTNTTNSALSIKLEASNSTVKRGTDTFDVSNFAYYLDTNNNGIYDAGVDTVITNGMLNGVAEDASVAVLVVANIPVTKATDTNLVNGDAAGIRLKGTAWKTDGTGAITTAATNNANAVDDVLAEAAANGSVANDGIAWDNDDYTVVSAAISAAKYSRTISDPVTGTSANAKMIPGAVVEYCIAVKNEGTIAATNVAITDVVPAKTTFVTGSVYTDQTVSSEGVCTGNTAATNGYSATPTPTVAVTLGTVGATTTKGVRFQVTVN